MTAKTNATKVQGLVVDDGSIKEEIKNNYGEVIGEFVFRPGDIGIVDRYNETVADFEKITEPLEKLDLNPDGTVKGDNDAAYQALTESKERLFTALNYVFNADVAGAFFGNIHPFSSVNGRFYCENAIEALGSYISDYYNKEAKKLSSKQNKNITRYTRDYNKGNKK